MSITAYSVKSFVYFDDEVKFIILSTQSTNHPSQNILSLADMLPDGRLETCEVLKHTNSFKRINSSVICFTANIGTLWDIFEVISNTKQTYVARASSISETVSNERLQVSAAVYLNFVVFWDVKQRRVVSHRRFGTTYPSYLPGSRCSSWAFYP